MGDSVRCDCVCCGRIDDDLVVASVRWPFYHGPLVVWVASPGERCPTIDNLARRRDLARGQWLIQIICLGRSKDPVQFIGMAYLPNAGLWVRREGGTEADCELDFVGIPWVGGVCLEGGEIRLWAMHGEVGDELSQRQDGSRDPVFGWRCLVRIQVRGIQDELSPRGVECNGQIVREYGGVRIWRDCAWQEVTVLAFIARPYGGDTGVDTIPDAGCDVVEDIVTVNGYAPRYPEVVGRHCNVTSGKALYA